MRPEETGKEEPSLEIGNGPWRDSLLTDERAVSKEKGDGMRTRGERVTKMD